MIKIPILFFILVTFFAFFAQHQQVYGQTTTTLTNTTDVPTSTTVVSSSTTAPATATPGAVNFEFPTFLYVGQMASGTITLSRNITNGKNLSIIAWLQDNSSLVVAPLTTTFDGSASGTRAWVSLTAVQVPRTSNSVMWDWSRTGTEADSFTFNQLYTSIQIRSLMTVWVSDIPATITNGTTISFSVTVSGAPPAGSIMVMPNFNSGVNGFFNVSSVTFSVNDTTWTRYVSFTATAPTMKATPFIFDISGTDYYAYNRTVMGGSPAAGNDIVVPTTTTTTTTVSSTNTTAAPTTTTTTVNTTSTSTTTVAPTTSTSTTSTTVASTSTAQTTNTTATTVAPSTSAPATTTTTTTASPTEAPVTINPSSPPPAWFILKLISTVPLSSTAKATLLLKLTSILKYPSNLITLGDVDASGNVLVVLNAPTSGAVNQTAVSYAVAVVDSMSTTNPSLLTTLGAASMTQGTPAPSTTAPADEGANLPMIIGVVVGAVVLIAIVLFVIKAKSSNGTGTSPADSGSPSRPLTNMEREMNQHQQHQRQQHQPQQGRYVDNEL